MKRISYIFILICCLLPVSLLAQQTVNMPSVDGEEKNVTVTAPITFYDAGGETGNNIYTESGRKNQNSFRDHRPERRCHNGTFRRSKSS